MNKKRLAAEITAYPFFDKELIFNTVTHPRIWPSISDDFCSIESYAPSEAGLWIAIDCDGYAGCFWLHAENSTTYQIHTCLLPSMWGRSAEAANLAVRWVFENTPCKKIITLVPTNNPLALRLAKRCGFEIEGVVTKSIQKDGVLLDQTLLGISEK